MSANMGLVPTKKCVDSIRRAFPEGASVELIFMDYSYRSMPRGLKGQVRCVDGRGDIHIAWENNSSLCAVWNTDVVKNIQTGIQSNEFWNDYQPGNK